MASIFFRRNTENEPIMMGHVTRTQIRLFGGILLIVFWGSASIAAAQEKAIGIVKLVKDHAFIIRVDERISCKVGDEIFQHDVLETNDTGSLGVTLKDNTRLSLGPSSRLALKEFLFNPNQKEYSFIAKIIHGTLVYISGIMGKLSPESVVIKTPTATVGIRGTRFVIRIEDEGVPTEKES